MPQEKEHGRSRSKKEDIGEKRKQGRGAARAIIFLLLGVCLGFWAAQFSYSAAEIQKEDQRKENQRKEDTVKEDAVKETDSIIQMQEEKGEESKPDSTDEESKKEAESERETEHLQIDAAEQETESQKGKVTVAFAGDVYLSDHVLQAYQKAGNAVGGILDEGFQNQIAQADWFVANEEFPFSDRGTQAKDKQFTFRLPTEKISMFQELQLDLVSLANNHVLDYGEEALLDTFDTLEQAGIRYMGAGRNLEEAKRPVIMENNGVKIGFLGATRVIPEYSWAAQKSSSGMLETYNPEVLIQTIQEVEKICDYVVVYVHWGVEKANMPEEYQRTMGKQYIDAGADLVVGSHPHVLQGVEYYKGKPIVYSLGNFIFGSQIPKTALLMAEFEDGRITLRLVPGTSKAGYTKMITEEGEKKKFFEEMQELSFHTRIGEDGILFEDAE